jgi:ACS family hexuronate transporter-like MFS transporter
MTQTSPATAASLPSSGHLRWIIVALIFIVTCINYIDRTSISLLKPVFGPQIHLSVLQYSRVGAILLFAYTLSQSVSGRLYDKYGARTGFTVSIIVWCLAAMAHSLLVGFASFAACSFVLGFGEAGNWPGAAKVIAEWFPQRERALGMAIFNGGASMGGVLGPLVVVGLEQIAGWRLTFLIIGAVGFLWLAAWLYFYYPLASHPRVTPAERAYIVDGQNARSHEAAPALKALLSRRQTWGILLARFIVDPVWWLYMLWLPSYLVEARHLNIRQLAVFAWAPYLCAALGALSGGWLAGRLIHRGLSVNAARKLVIAIAAVLMPFGILAARADTAYHALIYIAVVLFGFQMWISNVQTLPSDFFSNAAVGTVAGMGGTAAGISSLLCNLGTGWLVIHFGYSIVLTIAGVLSPIGVILLFLFIGRIQHVDLGPSSTPTTERTTANVSL